MVNHAITDSYIKAQQQTSHENKVWCQSYPSQQHKKTTPQT